MSYTGFVDLKKTTSSIVVNGTNAINIEYRLLPSDDDCYYYNEIEIWFKNKRCYYKYLEWETNPKPISYVVPIELLKEIPDSSVGTGTIVARIVHTSTGKIEEIKKSFTVYVPEEFKPQVSNLKIEMMDTKYNVVDYAVYGLTKPMAHAIVTPHSTSPIKKWYILGGGVTASGTETVNNSNENYNFHVLGELVRALSSQTFKLIVEDGRGRTAEIESEAIYVHPYNRPIVKSLSAYRTDQDGIQKTDGGYIKVTVEGGISPIRDSEGNEVNTLSCYLSTKKTTDSGFGGFKEITNGEPYIFEAGKDFSYELKCTLRDKYMETVAYASVVGDTSDFNIADEGGGAALGMKATKDYFDVAHKTRLHKNLSVTDEVSSKKGFVSTGTGSKGDFLSFGEATSISAYKTPGGFEYYDDFNDYTSIGLYGVYNFSSIDPRVSWDTEPEGSWIYNIPVNKPGTLRVYNATGDTRSYALEKRIMQEYVVYDGSAVYRRVAYKVRDNSSVEWPEQWTFGEWYCYSSNLNADTGWINLNSCVRYKHKAGYVTIIGTSYGTTTLKKDAYTSVGTIPSKYAPTTKVPIVFHTIGGSPISQSGFVQTGENVGQIQLYSNVDGISYWAFSVTYPI